MRQILSLKQKPITKRVTSGATRKHPGESSRKKERGLESVEEIERVLRHGLRKEGFDRLTSRWRLTLRALSRPDNGAVSAR